MTARDDTISADEAAGLLRVVRNTALDYARRDAHPLPSIKFGAEVRFLEDQVICWRNEESDRRKAARAERRRKRHEKAVRKAIDASGLAVVS